MYYQYTRYIITANFFLIFVMVWLEITLAGRDSYFSDAEYYFLAGFRESGACLDYDGSLLVCLYRALSFSEYNYFLFLLLFILSYIAVIISALRHLKSEKFKLVVAVFLFHPFIAFLIARGMKELLFILPLMLYLISLNWNKYGNGWIVIFVSSAFIFYLRPLGGYLAIAILLGSMFLNARYLWLSLVICLAVPLLLEYLPVVNDNLISHRLGFSDRDLTVQSIPAPIIFFFGPTPIRPILAMLGDFMYAFGTPITLYVLLIGSFFSINCAFLMPRYILFQIKNYALIQRYLFLSALSLISIYSFIYGGAVDTRHRGLFFCMLGTLVLITLVKQSNKDELTKEDHEKRLLTYRH